MALDTVIPNKANPILINFTFDVPSDPSFGLNSFTEINVSWLGVTHTLTVDTTVVVVNSNTQLQLNLGSVTSASDIPTYLVIEGINATYPVGNEFVLTNKCLSNLGVPCIC
tara:strand:- start:78 stop:410 length:333 start_codon:yes stop_codon:yes gene_type:complete